MTIAQLKAASSRGLRSYVSFITNNRRFLAFGFVIAFFSSFGQTFYIALFSDDIKTTFDLSDGQYGGLYSAATLASGFTVIWLGRLIDVIDLDKYAIAAAVGLCIAATIMSLVPNIAVLLVGLYLLRLCGQGLMSHTAITTMARYFDKDRGKAMSIAALGFPFGEAVLPLIIVGTIALIGWRETWAIVAILVIIVAVPLALLLLRGHSLRHAQHQQQTQIAQPIETKVAGNSAEHTQNVQRSWTRSQVLRDPRFYLIIPAIMSPGCILTGLFFHQLRLAAANSWSEAWYAACFVMFAAARMISAPISGPLVDRFTAIRLLPWYLWPLVCGCFILGLGDHPVIAIIYLTLVGITAGVTGTIIGAMWAELYGTQHLGAIRAMATAIGVGATALAPGVMGLMMDLKVSMNQIALFSGSAVAIAMIPLMIVVQGEKDK